MTSDSQPHASIIQFCYFFITRLLLRNPTTTQVSSPRILLPAHLLLLRAQEGGVKARAEAVGQS